MISFADLQQYESFCVFVPPSFRLLKQLASSLCDTETSAAMRTVNRKMSVAFNLKKKVLVGDEECGFCGSNQKPSII
jgi:hypothetical protein